MRPRGSWPRSRLTAQCNSRYAMTPTAPPGSQNLAMRRRWDTVPARRSSDLEATTLRVHRIDGTFEDLTIEFVDDEERARVVAQLLRLFGTCDSGLEQGLIASR